MGNRRLWRGSRGGGAAGRWAGAPAQAGKRGAACLLPGRPTPAPHPLEGAAWTQTGLPTVPPTLRCPTSPPPIPPLGGQKKEENKISVQSPRWENRGQGCWLFREPTAHAVMYNPSP